MGTICRLDEYGKTYPLFHGSAWAYFDLGCDAALKSLTLKPVGFWPDILKENGVV